MMGTMRKKYGVDQKVRVALEAIRGDKTLSEISSRFGVHSNQVSRWKRQALSGLPGIFSGAVGKSADAKDKLIEDLYCEIGKLKVETEFLKKVLSIAADKRRRYADTGDWDISVRRRCELLGVNRSGLYYQALGESEYNIMLMNNMVLPNVKTNFT